MCTMKKLDCVWNHTNNPTKWRLITNNATVKTKLMYGLESAQQNDSVEVYPNTLYLECLRQILNLEHTYLDRVNTNSKIYKEAEKRNGHKSQRQTQQLSET